MPATLAQNVRRAPVRAFGDFPLGATDAAVAVLADRLDTTLIVTLDRRHSAALRSPDGVAFTLLLSKRKYSLKTWIHRARQAA